jgi:hypothetical protein
VTFFELSSDFFQSVASSANDTAPAPQFTFGCEDHESPVRDGKFISLVKSIFLFSFLNGCILRDDWKLILALFDLLLNKWIRFYQNELRRT